MKFVKGLSILGLAMAVSGQAFAVSDMEATAYFTSTLDCHIVINDQGNLAAGETPETRVSLDAALQPSGSLSIAGFISLTASGSCPFKVTLGAFDMTQGSNVVKMVGSFQSQFQPFQAESAQSAAGINSGSYAINTPAYVYNDVVAGSLNPSAGLHWQAELPITGQMVMTVATP